MRAETDRQTDRETEMKRWPEMDMESGPLVD